MYYRNRMRKAAAAYMKMQSHGNGGFRRRRALDHGDLRLLILSLIQDQPRHGYDLITEIEQFSHINVLYWFHQNDTPENRSTLQVHPCKNKKNPLTGVFATHSPLRPNLIALSLCKVLSINGSTIEIDEIDAFDGTPVIDIKCFFPKKLSIPDVTVPNWEKKQD